MFNRGLVIRIALFGIDPDFYGAKSNFESELLTKSDFIQSRFYGIVTIRDWG